MIRAYVDRNGRVRGYSGPAWLVFLAWLAPRLLTIALALAPAGYVVRSLHLEHSVLGGLIVIAWIVVVLAIRRGARR